MRSTVQSGTIVPHVRIGDQFWMQENLNVDRYRNGDTIPEVQDQTTWNNLTTGAWCYYNNDPANGLIYGKLYNYFAYTDARGLAPIGWRVPTVADFNILKSNVNFDGGKLKSTGLTYWNTPNTGATNSTGFTLLPGGYRTTGETFTALKFNGLLALSDPAYYSATYGNPNDGYLIVSQPSILYDNTSIITQIAGRRAGFSVRCIKE